MAATSKPLTKKDLDLLNTHLKELEAIHADAQRAKSANVPGIDELIERCNDCKQRAISMKAAYFPNEA